MAVDVKKRQKELYRPKDVPALVQVPEMQFAAIDGKGDPNEPDGEYKRSIGLLYGVLYTIKMSPKAGVELQDYENFVVPPLEGLWAQDGASVSGEMDYGRKSDLTWTAMIRLPDFLTEEDFRWALAEASEKKGQDYSAVYRKIYEEGLCVQCMHTGPYDDEPETLGKMHRFMEETGLEADPERLHHEIYLSDPRRADPAKLKTVLRIPVSKTRG